jgi:hypothetical protein
MEEECRFTVIYRNDDSEGFDKTKDAITTLLQEQKVTVTLAEFQAARSVSFTEIEVKKSPKIDPFMHFDSKLITSPTMKGQELKSSRNIAQESRLERFLAVIYT